MYRKLVSFATAATVVVALSGCSDESGAPPQSTQPSALPTMATSSPSTAPSAPGGNIAVYTSTEMGSSESLVELEQVKEAGFNQVISYGSMNGRSAREMFQYLDMAQSMGIGVVFSLKDVLGVTDTDEVNAEHHRTVFGTSSDQSTDAQVTTLASTFISHPAVQSVLIADEQPASQSDLQEWLPRLKKRYDEIHKIKPVTVVMYWNPNSPEFYQQVKQYTDELQIDYYPLPESSNYGPVGEISTIGDTLRQTAGLNGCFVLQAFGWDPEAHPEGKALGFTKKSAAPTAAQMVDMAERAVVGNGHGGATNLAFYSLGDPGAANLQVMKEAVAQIRSAPWWLKRGN